MKPWLFALVILVALRVDAAVPTVVNFQGELRSPSGAPLDTIVDITFRIYHELASLTPVWDDSYRDYSERTL
ncbi:MAG: hypothetical protein IPG71_10605 [bacterium]|nr:hypothetical protein [bacterium]